MARRAPRGRPRVVAQEHHHRPEAARLQGAAGQGAAQGRPGARAGPRDAPHTVPCRARAAHGVQRARHPRLLQEHPPLQAEGRQRHDLRQADPRRPAAAGRDQVAGVPGAGGRVQGAPLRHAHAGAGDRARSPTARGPALFSHRRLCERRDEVGSSVHG